MGDDKKNKFETAIAAWAPQILSIVRIATGLLLLHHGTAKFFSFPTVPMFANLQVGSIFWVAGWFELIGGILLVIGLLTRPVAFILSGFAAVAYFYSHAGRGFYPILNGGEVAYLLTFICLYIAAAGPGPWSVDAAMRNRT